VFNIKVKDPKRSHKWCRDQDKPASWQPKMIFEFCWKTRYFTKLTLLEDIRPWGHNLYSNLDMYVFWSWTSLEIVQRHSYWTKPLILFPFIAGWRRHV